MDRRPDRLSAITQEFTRVGIHKWERVIGFDGKKNLPGFEGVLAGSIGCEISHIGALSSGIPAGIEAIMICEDDLEFVGSSKDIALTISEFLEDSRLDVLALSGRPRGGSVVISERLRIVVGLVGRGCYLVKPHMAYPLLGVFSAGLRRLEKGNLRGKGDLMWRKSQSSKYVFAFPRTDLALQAPSYSDIEERFLGPR